MSLILSGTDGLSDVDGSAATPAIRGTDANTGIFFPSADTIAFAEGGAEVARFDSSGNFGLGVTPSAWTSFSALQFGETGCIASNAFSAANTQTFFANNVYYDGAYKYIATGSAAAQYIFIGSEHRWNNAASGTAGNAITFTQAMTLSASGNLGITETSPTAKLQISVASAVVDGTKGVRITNPGGTAVMLECGVSSDSFVGTTSGSDFNIRTGNTVRATFDNAGNLLVGTTSLLGVSNTGTTHIAGGGSSTNQPPLYLRNPSSTAGRYWKVGPTNDAGYIIYNENNTGQYMVYGGSTWNSSSDERFKTDLIPIENAAAKVLSLRAVTGLYISDDEGTSRSFLIAQDVQAVLPEAVDVQDNEQKTLGLAYTAVIPLLVAAIKEQQALITQLTARITALESA